jgi:Rieske Fe-S protein
MTDPTPFRPLQEPDEITIAPDWRPMRLQPVWRNDFPVDGPQEQYVERREFMKFMVLTSLALAVGQIWIAVQSVWRRGRGQPEWQPVATLDQLPAGGVLTFAYPGEHDDCILIRTHDNALVAYSQKCTHLSCPVQPRVEDGVIRCPCHEGLFDLRSGRPIAGPPRRPLPVVRVEIHGNQIFATGVEVRTA